MQGCKKHKSQIKAGIGCLACNHIFKITVRNKRQSLFAQGLNKNQMFK